MKRWTCQTVQNETKVTDLLNLRNSFETQMLINLNLIQLCKFVSIAGEIENPVEILSLIILGCLCSLNWD